MAGRNESYIRKLPILGALIIEHLSSMQLGDRSSSSAAGTIPVAVANGAAAGRSYKKSRLASTPKVSSRCGYHQLDSRQ